MIFHVFRLVRLLSDQQESLWSMEESAQEEIPGAKMDWQPQHLGTADHEEYVILRYTQILRIMCSDYADVTGSAPHYWWLRCISLLISGMFKKWRQQKRRVDAENEKVLRVRAILTRNYKARVLQAWRVVNQEQQIISPMVARRDRKEMTRYAYCAYYRGTV